MEALEKRKSARATTLLAILTSAVTASVAAIAGLVEFVHWNFVIGLLSGISASLISVMVYYYFMRKVRGKEVGHAKQ